MKNAPIPLPPARSRSASVLRGEFHRQLTGQVLPREFLVLADVRRDHPADPAGLEQQAQAGPPVHTAVVADDGEIAGTLLKQRTDEKPRDSGQSESTDGQARAVRDIATASAAEPTTLLRVMTAPGDR